MNRIARTAAVAVMVATALIAADTAASAQTDSQYNRHLMKRYGCSTARADIWRHLQPSSVHGWLVTDFATSGGRWVHVSRIDYSSIFALFADSLHPQAVCKR